MQQEPISSETQATIDRLIPAPWSRRRRLMAFTGIGAVLIAAMYLWTGGWLTTNLELTGSQFGGDGPVTIGFQLTNNGARTIEILGAESSPGLGLVSFEIADQPLPALEAPALIPPNGTAIVIATYEVLDCAALDRTDTAFTFDVQFAEGPLQMKQQIQFQVEDFVFDEQLPGQVVSWPVAITQYVCP